MKIGLFLEDIGHQAFITGLIQKAARQSRAGVAPGIAPEFDVRKAAGGKPRMEASFRE